MKTIKELEQLIKMLRRQGVTEFNEMSDGGVFLRLGPDKPKIKLDQAEKPTKEVTEDDLYYSAGTAKPRKIK